MRRVVEKSDELHAVTDGVPFEWHTVYRRERERPYRIALAVGLAVSVLVHLLILFVAREIWVRGTLSSPVRPEVKAPEEGLVVIFLLPEETPPPSALPPREPEEKPAPSPLLPSPEPAPVGEPSPPGEEEPSPALTNAERLQPRMGDERLWLDFRDPITVARAEEIDRAVDALRRVVREWLDSLSLTEEQRRRALDWTFGEGDRRWGISEKGLHLGDVTIPIPFGQFLSQSGPRAREAARALRELQEIQAQDIRSAVEKETRRRREEMRRRSREEAERRKSSDSTRGGGT